MVTVLYNYKGIVDWSTASKRAQCLYVRSCYIHFDSYDSHEPWCNIRLQIRDNNLKVSYLPSVSASYHWQLLNSSFISVVLLNMHRHGSEPGLKDSGNDIDGNDQDGPLNRSYNSISSAPTNHASASSSKAVLAALRALQDKIRRLETERAQALDETVQLRHQMKNQEIESEHMKQRDNLASQKSLHEIRSAYERLLTEKTELEVRFSKVEDRSREEQQIAENLRCKIQNIEDEKHNGLIGIKDLEGERIQLQGQIQYIQQKEKGKSSYWCIRDEGEGLSRVKLFQIC